ncbi:DUF6457 domain-containing protein [Microlunatus soli]|nr:DUF6457 domain-containing protein [Microlunatus soli]
MELDAWLGKLADELKIGDVELDTDMMHTLLDLARDAAHQIDRPAAPLTCYLVGVAVGRGAALGATAATATAAALAVDD